MNAETQWTITKIVELCYQQSTSLSLASQCTGPSPPPWWDAINADEIELCFIFGEKNIKNPPFAFVTLPACHFPLRPPGWKRDRLYMRFLFSQVFVFLQAWWWELVWCPYLIFVSGYTWYLSSHKWWAMVFDFEIIHTESIEMIILSMLRNDKRRRKKLSTMSNPHVTCRVFHSWLIFVFCMVYVFVFGMVCLCLFLTSLMAGLSLMSNSHVWPFIS